MSRVFKRGIYKDAVIKKAKAFFENTEAGKVICDGVKVGDLYVCIRDNYFNVYRNGCALLKYKPNAGKHMFEVHKKYWVNTDYSDIETTGEDHLSLCLGDGQKTSTKQFIESIINTPNDNLKKYLENKNKGRASEKELLQAYLGDKKPCLIDLEVAFSCKNTKVNAKREFVAKRIDLAVLEKCDSGVELRFVEANVVSDTRLKAEKGEPEVFKQMEEYEGFLEDEADSILNSYQTIAKNFTVDFPYLIKGNTDKSLMEFFVSNGRLGKKPHLLLMADEKNKITSLENGKHGKNNGNHYKTLKDECDKEGWSLLEWIKND